MSSLSYKEIIEENSKRIHRINNYNYRTLPQVKHIAKKSVDIHFTLKPWEEWIINPNNKLDYTYNIYMPLEEDKITFPEELIKDIETLHLQGHVERKIENAILEEMFNLVEDEIRYYDTFWLSIDNLILDTNLKIIYNNSDGILRNFTGIKISLDLIQEETDPIIEESCWPWKIQIL